jgi:hypothetical protein
MIMNAVAQKEYYTIEESLIVLQENKLNINEKELEYYGEVGTLKFSLWVGSRPAYAAKYKYTRKEMFFIGHCKIHGIFPLQKGDVCGIFSNEAHLIELLYGHPHSSHLEITNWSTTIPNDAKLAKLGYEQIWTPEPYSSVLKYSITFFYLRPEMRLHMKEVTPGAFVPFNLIPENILNDAIKFDLGAPKQWPLSQIFKKIDLRITKNDLFEFIESFKPKEPISQEEPNKKDKRTTTQSEMLTALAKYLFKNGEGLGYTAFTRMLEEHSPTEPYEGIEGCTNIYFKEGRMHFTYTLEDGTQQKDDIDITSMKYHFKKAKNKK